MGPGSVVVGGRLLDLLDPGLQFLDLLFLVGWWRDSKSHLRDASTKIRYPAIGIANNPGAFGWQQRLVK